MKPKVFHSNILSSKRIDSQQKHYEKSEEFCIIFSNFKQLHEYMKTTVVIASEKKGKLIYIQPELNENLQAKNSTKLYTLLFPPPPT
jgi:hypothetical protein